MATSRPTPFSDRLPGYLQSTQDKRQAHAGQRLDDQKTSGAGQPAKTWTASTHEKIWQRPKYETGSYAQQYLSAYKSRWLLQRDPATAALVARQSVMARLQTYPTFRSKAQTNE